MSCLGWRPKTLKFPFPLCPQVGDPKAVGAADDGFALKPQGASRAISMAWQSASSGVTEGREISCSARCRVGTHEHISENGVMYFSA
jgi:hypothetical protein